MEQGDRRNERSRQRLLEQLAGEFKAMPGAALTGPQISRMFSLSPEVCERLLRDLVEAGTIEYRGDGRYARRSVGLL